VSQTFLAMDVGRFMPVEELQQRIEWLVNSVKSAAPAKGYSEVLVAGDPEWRAEAERRKNGIPLGDGTWDCLVKVGARLGVGSPSAPI
jgi:LDH2 family malate/lactate/ureidoglycolate dehydrogenase